MRLIIANANQFKIKHDLLGLAVMTFVTVLLWIAYSIYVAYNTNTIDPAVTSLLTPLEPTLNEKALSILSERTEPPTEFTILVKKEVGDSTVVVPLTPYMSFESNDVEETDEALEAMALESIESSIFEEDLDATSSAQP